MSIFNAFSRKSRQKKMDMLLRFFTLTESLRTLDIGGEIDPVNRQVIELHPSKKNLTVVNINKDHLDRIKKLYPDINVVCADAMKLPFKDKSFDLVYSNAVIEHVGGYPEQAAMAREIMRVGASWFITTPNRLFPFEFHMRLPFVSWLPRSIRDAFGKALSYNHVTGRYESGLSSSVSLLTARQLRGFFPGSRIVKCRVTIWPETLIAVSPDASGR